VPAIGYNACRMKALYRLEVLVQDLHAVIDAKTTNAVVNAGA
jgi:hypothetical protein